MDISNKQNVIACPKCEGSGKKNNFKCLNCSGYGVGIFFKNNFLYWGYDISDSKIKLKHIKRSLNMFIDILAFTISLLGLISLGYWIYVASADNLNKAFLFWQSKSPLILFFWISVLFDMFIYYRLSTAEAKKTKVKKIKDENIKIPNNWSGLKKFKNKLDISKSFSEESFKIIENAFLDAKKIKAEEFKSEHLFLSLLKNEKVIEFFLRLNVDIKDMIEKTVRISLDDNSYKTKNQLKMSIELKELLINAYFMAYFFEKKKVNPIDLILPCFFENKAIADIFLDYGLDKDKIINVMYWFKSNEDLRENYRIYKKMAKYKPGKNMDRAYTAVATLVLNHFSYDLTAMAKLGRLNFCVSREAEIEGIFNSFKAGDKGILLVGEKGVGKRIIVHKIAKLMVEEKVPSFLQDKRLVELDAARIISGSTPSQAEQKLLVILDEIMRAGNIVLYIKNIENLVGITSGSKESMELSDVLADAIERKRIYCLATVESDNYFKYVKNNELGSAFSAVKIEEPDDNRAIRMLQTEVILIEGKHKVYFSYNAIERAVVLSRKYIYEKFLPKKAIDVSLGAAVNALKKNKNNENFVMVTKSDIEEEVSRITGIPMSGIAEDEQEKLMNLEDIIHKRMVNQTQAVKMVASSLRRARAEMREGKRPIAGFLFLGPTGVGKTELAKTVAEVYFNNEKNMIRLDMSEYQHQDSVKKMIGDENGSLGFLTEEVRKKPFSLILLDELEKAHPNILNLFLQVFEDGRLTDHSGKTVDFTNTIIIATSNLGSMFIQKEIEKGNMDLDKVKQELIDNYLSKVLRLEFINRFDGISVFKPLSLDNIIQVTKLLLRKTEKMLSEKGIGFFVKEGGIKKIAEKGYDPKFGARPLRRFIQDTVESDIAGKILSGEVKRRDKLVINDDMKIEIEKGKEL
jgi:ATP-dependent Clp protease ATP-binding subunit ClpC